MGKLKNIKIFLSENKTIYQPGETLTGYIVVESRGEITINGLRIFMRGLAKCHWTETKTGGYRIGNYSEHYSTEIEYFCFRQILVDGKGTDI